MSFLPISLVRGLYGEVWGGGRGLTVFERGVDAGDGDGVAHCVLGYVGNDAAGGEGDVVRCGYGGAVGKG